MPEVLLEEARAHGLPVITVPGTTPFRTIVELVARSGLGEDVKALQRVAAMQRYLMAALGDESPQATAIERLSMLLSGDVALLTREGYLDIGSGASPPPELRQRLIGRAPTTIRMQIGDRVWAAAPVVTRAGAINRWIVASTGSREIDEKTLTSAMQAAVPLLIAVDRIEAAQRGQRRAIRGAVLDRLIAGDRDPIVAAQLSELGFEVGSPAVVVVIGPDTPDSPLPSRALGLVESVMDQTQRAFLARVTSGGSVIALVQADEEFTRSLGQALSDAEAQIRVGIGSPASVPTEVGRSLREAELAYEDLRRSAGFGVRDFASLDLTAAILSEVPMEGLRGQAQSLIAALDSQPAGLDTLRTYFDYGLSMSAAAGALHLHQNSLRNRLSRIEEAIGVSLRDPSTITAVFLALRALQVEPGAPLRRLSKQGIQDA